MIINLSSRGPWYPPIVKFHSMVGTRAMRAGQMRYSAVQSQILEEFEDLLPQRHDRDPGPTLQTVRNWEKENPNYPEEALRDGWIREDQLLPWARRYLRTNEDVPWTESTGSTFNWHGDLKSRLPSHTIGVGASLPSTRTQRITPQRGTPSLGAMILVLGGVWLLGKLSESRPVLAHRSGLRRTKV